LAVFAASSTDETLMQFDTRCNSFCWTLLFAAIFGVVGCGTTRSSDTTRTATEQLLISDSIDRTVETINFRPIAGRRVYLDETYLSGIVDRSYLVSTLRQHMLASGCILATSRDKADYIVEARAGTVGTNHNTLLFGIPAINVPSFLPLPVAVPASIPEVPIVKRTDRRGVSKIAVFAYHRESGAPVWQSGIVVNRSTAKDTWVLGAGPFQQGTIHRGMEFAGSKIRLPLKHRSAGSEGGAVVLRDEVLFEQPGLPANAAPVRQADATANSNGSQTPNTRQ